MFLDIETLPAQESKKDDLLDIYQRKAAKAKKEMESFEEYLESTGLDGSFGRICCISYALDDGPVKTLSGDETEIVKSFWDIARQASLYVGHNLIDFDMRFILQRSVILGVKPTVELNFARYRSSPMYDVMYEWSRWNNQNKISLHALAKALGLKSSKEGGIEGKDVAQAFRDGRIEEICRYCEADVTLTREIYRKMTFE